MRLSVSLSARSQYGARGHRKLAVVCAEQDQVAAQHYSAVRSFFVSATALKCISDPAWCLEIVMQNKMKLSLKHSNGGPEGYETSRLPHFADNRLTSGAEFLTLTRWPPFTPTKIPGTHFCQRLSQSQGHSAAGRIRSVEISNDLIENRTR
jgi:hypothetical protein